MSEQLPKLLVSYEHFRSLVLRYLEDAHTDPTLQFNNLRCGVAEIVATLEPSLIPGRIENQATRSWSPVLSDPDYALCCDIVWDLIIEGVVRPGPTNGSSSDLPHFHLTDFGRSKIKELPGSPYDPDGYLKRLKAKVQSLDSVVLAYLCESLHTFRIDCLLSSTITLGCASEKAILLLIDAYTEALPHPRNDNFRRKIEGKMIKNRFEEFSKKVEGHLKSLLPKNMKEDLDTSLSSIFAMLREHRNDAGHPTGKTVTREQAHAHLQVFPHYIQTIYVLMDWISKNKPLM